MVDTSNLAVDAAVVMQYLKALTRVQQLHLSDQKGPGSAG